MKDGIEIFPWQALAAQMLLQTTKQDNITEKIRFWRQTGSE